MHPQGTDPLVQHGGRDLQSPTRGAVFSDFITGERLEKFWIYRENIQKDVENSACVDHFPMETIGFPHLC